MESTEESTFNVHISLLRADSICWNWILSMKGKNLIVTLVWEKRLFLLCKNPKLFILEEGVGEKEDQRKKSKEQSYRMI